jgi:hypothetical protein
MTVIRKTTYKMNKKLYFLFLFCSQIAKERLKKENQTRALSLKVIKQ